MRGFKVTLGLGYSVTVCYYPVLTLRTLILRINKYELFNVYAPLLYCGILPHL